MQELKRQDYLQQITKKVGLFTMIILIIIFVDLYFDYDKQKSYLMLMVFSAGFLGGFMSIQQRLPKMPLSELKLLSSSWVSMMLIPINGGVFAMVLMLMFVGGIIQGDLFPKYESQIHIINSQTFFEWIATSYPQYGKDIAKLLFWSFVAGFSERFVPQLIKRTSKLDDDFDQNENNQQPKKEA